MSDTNNNSIRHDFITQHAVNNTNISIYLNNGIRLKGRVVKHDEQVVVLSSIKNPEEPILIFIDAIASIDPNGD